MSNSTSNWAKILLVIAGGLFLALVLATPFLSTPPIWQQALIGIALTGHMIFLVLGSFLFGRRPSISRTRARARWLLVRSSTLISRDKS